MRKLHWWDSEYTERQRLNEAADELYELQSNNAAVGDQVARLFELDRDQGRDIDRLQATVLTLLDMLIDRGVLDEQALVARMNGALEELDRREQEGARRQAEQGEARNPFRVAPRTPPRGEGG